MKAARILVVGEAELAELCVTTLEKRNPGHVLMVIGGSQSDRVVSIAEAFKPDAVLLLSTNNMSPVAGADLCRLLRASPATAGAKIILFSSDSLKKGLAAAKGCGADGFIRKPFEPEKLIAMVELLLS